MNKPLSIAFVWCILAMLCHSANGQSLDSCEYWYDHDFNNRQVLLPNALGEWTWDEALGVPESLSPGNHMVSMRFHTQGGDWSPAATHRFFIPVHPKAGSNITEAQYWWDHNLAAAQTIPISPANEVEWNQLLDGAPGSGLHVLSIRFMDDLGYWSPPVNRRLYIDAGTGTLGIDAYRYWYDDAFASSVTVNPDPPASPYILSETLEVTNVPAGPNHQFCIQFRNTAGIWSSMYCRTFDNYYWCLGDMNNDQEVDTADLLLFLSSMGCQESCGFGDLTFDGVVDAQDLLLFLGAFGGTCN
ncbi:MAG: hypothetical protein KDC12_01310 [Flavobacteriales bacterium]|nr:hypothetical protein [Flavobacteriales bacterium]